MRRRLFTGGTLFSGIGAPEYAAPWVDWRWCAEFDPAAGPNAQFAAVVHAAHFPNIPNLGDVTRIDPDAIEPVDLIVFGSPCQSFSIAGKRLGLDDPRGDLALLGLRVVERVRPRWLVFENVLGLLSSYKGRDFGAFLGALGQCGYGVAYRVLDAQYTGVPQRRRRVFVVGYIGDWRPAAAVLFEPESLSGYPAPRREARQAVARPIGSCAEGGSGCRNDADTADNIIPIQNSQRGRDQNGLGVGGDVMFTLDQASQHAVAYGGNRLSGPIDVATALLAHGGPNGHMDFESETFITHSPRIDDAPSSAAFNNTGQGWWNDTTVAAGLRDMSAGSGSKEATLVALQQGRPGDGASAPIPGFGQEMRGSLHEKNKSPRTSMSVRRLTPTECERLQGFPDNWTAIQYRGKPAADGPRYRALGNSMAAPVIRWIGNRIRQVEERLLAP